MYCALILNETDFGTLDQKNKYNIRNLQLKYLSPKQEKINLYVYKNFRYQNPSAFPDCQNSKRNNSLLRL